IIARVGQTGLVDTPQLHFELRRGKRPVDPLRHLPPLTASRRKARPDPHG
ncbi:MAG: M23 family metallopeptidase, partial [Alphaproteobacteria bacterium]